MYVLSDIALGL